MNWKTIRLELAASEEFPEGSVSRAYLLRLPLNRSGLVDEAALRGNPRRATVQRFWPSEPDRIGHVVPTARGWAFRYESCAAAGEANCTLDPHPLRIGEQVTLTDPEGRRLPFRVASLTQVNGARAA